MFDQILPPDVSTVVSVEPPADFQLSAEEKDATARFAPRRLREFMQGRACARAALARLGCESASIPVGASREPLWPSGFTGSITHCDGIAAAAVCRLGVMSGIGIDCERLQVFDNNMVAQILTADEVSRTAGTGAGLDCVLFGAKESFYKCVWPLVRRWVGFHEIEVHLHADDGTFTAAPTRPGLDTAMVAAVQGRWAITATHAYTAAYLPA